MCPLFMLRYPRGAPPPKGASSAARDYDNILGRVVHRDFGLAPALRQFLSQAVPFRPDLSQEVLRAVAVEDQLARLLRLC